MKRVAKKTTKKTASKGSKKKAESGYKRGSLNAAIMELFEKNGVDEVTLEQAQKVAKKVKPDSPFNANHLAWYKNKYRNDQQ